MSIHAHNSPFIRPRYVPGPKDHMKRHHAPPFQRPLNFFFSCIIGKPEERKLVEMMNQGGVK